MFLSAFCICQAPVADGHTGLEQGSYHQHAVLTNLFVQRYNVLIVHALCTCHHVDQSAAVASHSNGYAASIRLFHCSRMTCSRHSSQAMQSICSSCLTRKDFSCRSTSKLVLFNMSRCRRHASGLLCLAGRQLGGALHDPLQCHPAVEHLPSV